MAENQLLRFANGSLPNVISYAEWKNLPEVTKGFVSGIAKSANMNRVIAQGALAGYVMGQAIVNLLGKNATLESSTFYEDFLAALCKHIPGNVADASIPTAKLSERATKQDIENGTAMRVVCADVVKQYFDMICPPGMITFFHATDVPEGWLLCNGAAVSRTTYSRLFAKIGTKYGAGDGSTTFALPNLDGRVLQGTTNTGNVGNYLEASLPNILGAIQPRGNTGFGGQPPNSGAFVNPSFVLSNTIAIQLDEVNKGGVVNFDASRCSNLYSGSTMQTKAIQCLPCIRI